MLHNIVLKSGARGWRGRLREVYSNSYEEFINHNNLYNISLRIGYKLPRNAWKLNPVIEGGINPSDLRRIGDRMKRKK